MFQMNSNLPVYLGMFIIYICTTLQRTRDGTGTNKYILE